MKEKHFNDRIGWLRAAVLGANDGIVSTSSLVVGIAAASIGRTELLLAAVAGLVAGAMSMAAGEYVSVSSQADTERADLERETFELENFPEAEHQELTDIYEKRGLEREFASKVAEKLMAHNALETHARDELGLTDTQKARPILAAFSSAASFIIGAALPVILVALVPMNIIIPAVSISSLVFLSLLGAIAAKAGGANIFKGATRVTFWGALAMAATAIIGYVFGAVV